MVLYVGCVILTSEPIIETIVIKKEAFLCR